MGKDTPKEAVCQVFENVNAGGVSLTIFELVTAIFAMGDFEFRKDWENHKEDCVSKAMCLFALYVGLIVIVSILSIGLFVTF